jgi:dipeptidyl aminopeptidase/acylaminoacyl peptidase
VEKESVMRVPLHSRRPRRALVPLGAVVMLVSASSMSPTELSAQTVPPGGKIVFVRPSTESSEHCFGQPCADIWVMDGDGSNETNLTNTLDVNEGQPAWSADGTRIAYTSDGDEVGGFSDIWVMNADGSAQTNITPTAPDGDNVHEYQPSWAPSGTQIVFVRQIPGEVISEQPDIFVMDTDPATDDATNITESDASEIDPAWSPDGTKIAFAGVRNQGFEIVTMDPDGQNELILTGDAFDGDDRAPDWSADSTKVAFMKQSQVGGCCDPWEVWAVNRDGTGDTNLTNHPADDMGPSWSPDGTQITFTSTRDASVEEPFRADIYVMAAPATLPPPADATAAATIQGGAERLTTDGESTDPDWAEGSTDTAPRVTSTSPSAGATGVLPTVNVTATFSEAMRVASIHGQTFKLFRKGSTTKVAASVRYGAVTRKATLDPTNALRRGITYKAVVTTGAKDLAGNNLDQNSTLSGRQQHVWFFTVRS